MAVPAGAEPKCGWAQENLIELKARIKKGELDYDDYFFNVEDEKGKCKKYAEKFGVKKDDGYDRCIECGRTIGEHPISAHSSLSATDDRDQAVDAIMKDRTIQTWRRPTPRPLQLIRSVPLYWPGTTADCATEPMPRAEDLNTDFRSTAIGIGNAFGTGKTEVAVNGAEVTVAAESDTSVAYLCFGNGYKDNIIAGKLQSEEFAGVWLYAGKMATRIFDLPGGRKELRCNPAIFKRIVTAFLTHEDWPRPIYSTEAHGKLIIVVDEVQEFSREQLDDFLSIAVASQARMTLLVGAFSPSFVYPSGNRLVDMKFSTLTFPDVEALFRRHILHGESTAPVMSADGTHLPSLFGSAIRPLTTAPANFNVFRHNNPIGSCEERYGSIHGDQLTDGLIFRAALAGVPVRAKTVNAAFDRGVSLGSAYLTVVDREGPTYFVVDQPPLAVSLSCFHLLDVCGPCEVKHVTHVLANFVNPNWSQFEDLVGVGPALRIAALSAFEMGYDLGGRTVLEHVFGSALCTTLATPLLKYMVCPDVRVRYIPGGTNLDVLTELKSLRSSQEVALISMNHHHSSEFDLFLIVPATESRWILFCSDAKFSVHAKDRLNSTKHLEMKLGHFKRLKAEVPDDMVACLLIISNKPCNSEILKDHDDIPAIVCTRKHLKDCLSPILVPPRFRVDNEATH